MKVNLSYLRLGRAHATMISVIPTDPASANKIKLFEKENGKLEIIFAGKCFEI